MGGTMISRALPLLIALSGAAAATVGFDQTFGAIIDVVKSTITRFEMSQLSAAIQQEVQATGSVPDTSDLDAVGNFIRDSASGNFDRDPAFDLWGNPYLLVAEGSESLTLLSLGPNGVQDESCVGHAADQAALRKLGTATNRATAQSDTDTRSLADGGGSLADLVASDLGSVDAEQAQGLVDRLLDRVRALDSAASEVSAERADADDICTRIDIRTGRGGAFKKL